MTIKHSIYTSPEFPQDRERRLLGLDYDGNLTFEGGHVSPLTVIPTGGDEEDARTHAAWAAAIVALEDAPPPAFSDVTGKPTTLSGYGITDATAKVSSTTATAFAKFSDTAGTLANSVLTIDANAIVNGGMYRTTQLTIADDAVGTYTCPANTTGHVAVAASAGAYTGFASFRAGSTPSVTLYTGSGGSIAATTGALAGTTGTDGKLTVSAHTDSLLYFENRVGATSVFGITILVR